MEPEKYGDLILWFQTIDKVKEENRPIFLITDEKKEDWWLIHKGKRIGPRPELIQEMINETEFPCYIYRADHFIENAKKYLQKEITQKAIDEVREVRKRDEEEQLHEEMTFSDKVDVEVFRPSASDAVRALNLDAIDYAIESSRSYEELRRNMGALNQLKDALSSSSRAARILERIDPLYKIERILREIDHVEKIRESVANRTISEEHIKNMEALNKYSELMNSVRPTKRKVDPEKSQSEDENDEKPEETK